MTDVCGGWPTYELAMYNVPEVDYNGHAMLTTYQAAIFDVVTFLEA